MTSGGRSEHNRHHCFFYAFASVHAHPFCSQRVPELDGDGHNTKTEARVGTQALVRVRISEQGVVAAQSEARYTHYKGPDGVFEMVEGSWIVPIPRMENFAWQSNGKRDVLCSHLKGRPYW